MVASWFRYIQDIKTVQLAVSMHAVAEGHRIEVKVGVSDVSFHVRTAHYGEENPSHLKYISHVISFQNIIPSLPEVLNMKNNQLRCKNTVVSNTIVNIDLSEAYD